MSDVAPATPAAPAPMEPVQSDIAVHTPGGEGKLSLRDAANSVIDWRRKRDAADTPDPDKFSPSEFNAEARKAQAGSDGQKLAPEANADSPQETTGEDQAAEPETPAIDPPRSWTKEANERWSKLDPETQQWIVDRDREDQAAIKRALNEASDKRKAAEAEQAQVAQARQQYEYALPALLQTMFQQQAGEFGDIKTHADLQRLAAEDPARYLRYDAQQKQIAAVAEEVKATNLRQQQDLGQRWFDYAKSEDQKFAEKVPDIADPKKAPKLREDAVSILKDHGFKEDELGQLWNGQASLSLRDHRLQLLILDGVKYREAKQTAKAAVAKPVPPVQRPGVAPSKTAGKDAVLKDLSQQIDKTKGVNQLRAAARFISERRSG